MSIAWEHGGRQVFVTGTFNDWTAQIPMHRSGNDFTYIHNLKKGKHAFKFVVDDEWSRRLAAADVGATVAEKGTGTDPKMLGDYDDAVSPPHDTG